MASMRLSCVSSLFLGALLAACGTSPTPTVTTTPTTGPSAPPAPSTVTQPPSLRPTTTVVCDDEPTGWTTTEANGSDVPMVWRLTCEKAVAAAEDALPPMDLNVRVVEFRTGGYCPPGARCAAIMFDRGYVVFTMEDGSKVWASVSARDNDVVAAFEGAFPPA